MNKFLLMVAAGCIATIGASAQQNVSLYGQLYNGSGDYGVYKFSSGTEAGSEKIISIAAEPNCGSVKAGDRFYVFTEEPGDWGSEFAAYVYDTTDYTLVTRIGSAWGIAKPQQVLAYDPVTKKIFTTFIESSYYGSESYLGVLDVSNRTITKVGYGSLYFGYGSTYIVAMAFNPEGELYGIASNGILYKINTSNADLTYIGSTGLSPEYEQSMAFSPDGTTIYWAGCGDTFSGLYSVNPSTGRPTLIKNFSSDEEYASLWVGDPEAAPDAPAAPENIQASFSNGSLTGQISFTAPTLTHAGNPLSGSISYTVIANDEEVGEGTTVPGASAAASVTLPGAGLYDFQIALSNTAGLGDRGSLNNVWVGPDVPMGVNDLTLTAGADNTYIISWTAPTEGAHGGYVDSSTLKYRIRRLPEFETISENATSPFSDSFYSETPTKLSYEVMPYVDADIRGLALTTNSIMVGSPYAPPYTEDFGTSMSAVLWTIADSNDDGHSWEYQWDFGYFRIYDNDNAKDDWLISPYISLNQSEQYKLSFDVRTIADETLEVCLGTSLDPSDMTEPLMEPELIPDTDFSWVRREILFFAPADAPFHIGFHAMTSDPSNALALYIDNVNLESTGTVGVAETYTESETRIYTMQGIRIDRPAETLPAGLYIVNGRKVLVR